jgi:hypothetical protein
MGYKANSVYRVNLRRSSVSVPIDEKTPSTSSSKLLLELSFTTSNSNTQQTNEAQVSHKTKASLASVDAVATLAGVDYEAD